MGIDLKEFKIREEGAGAFPAEPGPPKRRRPKNLIIVLAAAVVVLAMGAGFLLHKIMVKTRALGPAPNEIVSNPSTAGPLMSATISESAAPMAGATALTGPGPGSTTPAPQAGASAPSAAMAQPENPAAGQTAAGSKKPDPVLDAINFAKAEESLNAGGMMAFYAPEVLWHGSVHNQEWLWQNHASYFQKIGEYRVQVSNFSKPEFDPGQTRALLEFDVNAESKWLSGKASSFGLRKRLRLSWDGSDWKVDCEEDVKHYNGAKGPLTDFCHL